MRARLGVLGVLGALGACPARADPLDTFGFDARGKAMGNAMTAGTSALGASFYNPAGAALAPAPEIGLGYSYAAMLLSINDRDARVTAPRGVSLGLAVPARCGAECRVAIGFAFYMPDQFVTRIQAIPVSEPHFVLLDNDVDRIVVNPSAALRLGPIAVGAGVTLLADAAGNGIDFTVGGRGGMQVGEAKLDVALPTRAAALLGLLWTPLPGLRVGASYRGELDLKLRLDILAHVDIPGGGDTVISIRALNSFTPRKLSFGVAWELSDRITLAADASYYNWADFSGGVTDLRLLVDLQIAPALLMGSFPADRLHDTMTLRAGSEWRHDLGPDRSFALRAGLAYEPSPVPDQVLLTSFADNDRFVISTGAGLRLTRIVGLVDKPLALDAALEWHQLMPRQTQKLDPALPAFSSAGGILHLAVTATATF